MCSNQRSTSAIAYSVLPLLLLLGAGIHAKGNIQISGMGELDVDEVCPGPPDGFEEFVFFTVVLEGDLLGCLYTAVDSEFEFTPSNVYDERGREVVVACLDVDADGTCDQDEPAGMFETTYHFTSKWAGEPFAPGIAQIYGRCQHPIVRGSGTDGFAGIAGRLDFRDNVDQGNFSWRGHLKADVL